MSFFSWPFGKKKSIEKKTLATSYSSYPSYVREHRVTERRPVEDTGPDILDVVTTVLVAEAISDSFSSSSSSDSSSCDTSSSSDFSGGGGDFGGGGASGDF